MHVVLIIMQDGFSEAFKSTFPAFIKLCCARKNLNRISFALNACKISYLQNSDK